MASNCGVTTHFCVTLSCEALTDTDKAQKFANDLFYSKISVYELGWIHGQPPNFTFQLHSDGCSPAGEKGMKLQLSGWAFCITYLSHLIDTPLIMV